MDRNCYSIIMGQSKRVIGLYGEESAVQYLKRKGYSIIERNVYIAGGEIDIVAKKDTLLVFVEVKTRKSDVFVDPLDVLDDKKSQQLIDCCDEYMTQKKLLTFDYRIDLITILICGQENRIEHITGII